MLRLLGKAASINVAKVMWTAAELGLEVAREDWGAGYAPLTDPGFTALNPNRTVPVLIDGDFVLWESNTIIRYLAERAGAEALYARAPRDRARVNQWIDWQASDLNGAWRYAFTALVRRDPAFDDQRSIDRSLLQWSGCMAVLERQLATTGAYVAGTRFTLADIPIGLSVLRWFAWPEEGARKRPKLPAVDAYLSRLNSRPAFVEHGVRNVV